MSLIVLYKDELVADQCCVLTAPHSLGQTVLVNKTHMASDKTFVYATVGPTLTDKEKLILEEIIRNTFKVSRGEQYTMALESQDWFKHKTDLCLLIMTKETNYFGHFIGGSYDASESYRPRGADPKLHSITQFDSTYPACYGTGAFASSIAALEGVKMNALMPIVSEFVYTVSPEYNLINRRELKRMNYK